MQTTESKGSILVNGKGSVGCTIDDRGLQYGHGVFETIAIKQGKPEYWEQHMTRLIKGCQGLQIKPPDVPQLKNEALSLCQGHDHAVLKVIYTAGIGTRGYRSPENSTPTRILSLSAWPDHPEENHTKGVTLCLCQTRLGKNSRLAKIKHLNRLEQVLARSEWSDPSIAEGIMLDQKGALIEATMSNLFFVKEQRLYTPLIEDSGIEGVMRGVILDLAKSLNITLQIGRYTPEDLFQADEVFLTNSLIGIWPVATITQYATYESPGAITETLINALQQPNIAA